MRTPPRNTFQAKAQKTVFDYFQECVQILMARNSCADFRVHPARTLRTPPRNTPRTTPSIYTLSPLLPPTHNFITRGLQVAPTSRFEALAGHWGTPMEIEKEGVKHLQ